MAKKGIFKTPKYESHYAGERKAEGLQAKIDEAKRSRVSAQELINKPTSEIRKIAKTQRRDINEAKFEKQKSDVQRMAKPVFDIIRGGSYGSHSARTSHSSGFARGRGLERRKIL